VREILDDPEIDIVVELIGGYEPARTYLLEAMKKGKHVVTANKALLASYWLEIITTASNYRVDIYFEASVGAGIPVIQSLNEGLSANRIQSIYGIVNGTTNYILTHMTKEGKSFSQALKEARKQGYAEAEPRLDLEGIDSAHKICILSAIAFGTSVKLEDIYTEGITHLQVADIRYAREEFDLVIKLLAIAKYQNQELEIRVHPTLIPQTHLLAAVENVYNAIYVVGDAVGATMFYGLGAGQMPAASAVVSDIMYLARNIASGVAARVPNVMPPDKIISPRIKKIEEIISRYYLRFSVVDQPGVLSHISGILGEHGISISAVIQKEQKLENIVPVVMLTYEAQEREMRKALQKIDRLPVVKDSTVLIRVEKG
jgi:homoserine dehydrogenase